MPDVEMNEVTMDIDFRSALAQVAAFSSEDHTRYVANPTGQDAASLLSAIFAKIEAAFPSNLIKLRVRGSKILYQQ